MFINKDPVSITLAQLEIRQRRNQLSGKFPPKDALLTGPEEMAFNVITKQIISRSPNPAEAEKSLQSGVDKHGKKMLVDIFAEPALVMGVPYQVFVANAIISMVAFIITQSFSILTIIAPAIHLLGYIYYRLTGPKAREQRINTIISEGIKI